MTKLCTETLEKFVELCVSNADYRSVCRACGISENTVYNWRARSIADAKANDTSSPFWITFRNVPMYFHNAVGAAREEFLISYTGKLLAQANDGIKEQVLDSTQHPVYQEDPQFIGRSDEWVMSFTGCTADDVDWERLKKDADGHPVPLYRVQQLPAPIRLRILEAAESRFRATQNIDVTQTIEAVHVIKRPGADGPRPDIAALRKMLEDRRASHPPGSKPSYPHDGNGRYLPPNTGAPRGDDRPDDGAELPKPPNPRMYQEPELKPPTPQRPSYARPARSLDQSGRGQGVPPNGGFKIA